MAGLQSTSLPLSGEIAETLCSQELVKILECPVCCGIPYPPIYGCYNGHIVCNSCRPRLKDCALCRKPYWEGRNRVIEAIVNSSKFYCNYKEEGCKQTVTGGEMKGHLRTCKFGPAVVHEDVIDEPGFMKWVRCVDGVLPEGAFQGGSDSDGHPLYVCRADHEGGKIPGKFSASAGKAYIPWGCTEHEKTEYEILTVVDPASLVWTHASSGYTPPNAIVGGPAETGETLFIGRWKLEGSYIVGKIHPSHGCCFICDEGEELRNVNYEVLTRLIDFTDDDGAADDGAADVGDNMENDYWD